MSDTKMFKMSRRAHARLEELRDGLEQPTLRATLDFVLEEVEALMEAGLFPSNKLIGKLGAGSRN